MTFSSAEISGDAATTRAQHELQDDYPGAGVDPVVIVPLSSNYDTEYSDGSSSPTGHASSPMAVSLTAKKRRALLALAVPFVLALTFRLINTEPPLPTQTNIHDHYLNNNVHATTTPQRYTTGTETTTNLFDVNAPPVELAEGETIAHLLETKSHDTQQLLQANSADANEADPPHHFTNPLRSAPAANSFFGSRAASLKQVEEKPLPVVLDRGEKIPAGVGMSLKKQSAAEALMCRDSVINYVINATNGKDECTGLQKAFDETCSQEDEDADAADIPPPPEQDPKTQDQNDIWLGEGDAGRRGRRRRLLTRQRRTKRWYKQHLLTFLIEEAYRYLDLLSEWIPWFEKPKFNAENAVFDVYGKAKHREILREKRGRQLLEEVVNYGDDVKDDDDLTKSNATSADDDDDDDEDDDEAQSSEETQQPVKAKPVKPHQFLSLPTGQSHVSGKTLEKTLLLQQEGQVLSNLKKAAAANVTATNVTKIDAKEDAAASAKAVSDTSELVSAVLNDPTSIEARACCSSILNVYHENCNTDAEEDISDKRLFIVVLIMAFCGMVKSLIRHFKIRWLPEAAGCILVGVASGFASSFFPHQDFSFDGNWFLRILVPPIVFEAALSIDKRAFNRHLVPIIIYSTFGTVFATLLTATIVHKGTMWLGRFCETIPYIESLIFGALISSIDPIAVLSVLSNMGMTDTDTLYVLVFGESLLNDGVAIVLFHTLVQFLDTSVVIDNETIMAAVVHFFVVACGSILVGVGSGIMCTLYYWGFHGCQTPLVEVLMFLCWALFPYYVCDGIGWSGIVSIVTVGFLMDMYVIGVGDHADDQSEHSHGSQDEDDFGEVLNKVSVSRRSRPIFSGEGHLSAEARTHIGFVTEIVATMMETAIFAYLGLFLFSHRYHWNGFHVFISIFACSVSRGIMIPVLSTVANWITGMQKYQNRCRGIHKNSPATGVIVDRRMQMVLWFAGLRGAMSFALVEHIPLFDAVTGEGTRVKAELKAMTSASIMFTVFVLGGLTNYFMDYVGLSPASAAKGGGRNNYAATNKEIVPLTVSSDSGMNDEIGRDSTRDMDLDHSGNSRKTRQRVRPRADPER